MKKFVIFLFVLMTLATLGIIGLVASVTWDQYQDTKKWQKTELSGDLKDIPPFLARNYVQEKDQKAAEAWQELSDTLKKVQENNGIHKDDWKAYQKVHDRAVKRAKKYGAVPESVTLQAKRLQLYLDLEKAFAKAYKEPSAEKLRDLSGQLYTVNLESPDPSDSLYFTRLHAIATDYANLAAFFTDLFPKLGAVEDGVLILNTDVDEDVTKEVKERFDVQGLGKFPFLEGLEQLVGGNDWAVALSKNEAARDYASWHAVKASLESVQKSEYWQVGWVTTYQQAMDMGLPVTVNEREGFTISPESPVYAITYNGVALSPEQYVRYGTPVEVTLTEDYVEVPKEEDDEEDEEDGKADKKPGTKKPGAEAPKDEEDETGTGGGNDEGDGTDGSGNDGNAVGEGTGTAPEGPADEEPDIALPEETPPTAASDTVQDWR